MDIDCCPTLEPSTSSVVGDKVRSSSGPKPHSLFGPWSETCTTLVVQAASPPRSKWMIANYLAAIGLATAGWLYSSCGSRCRLFDWERPLAVFLFEFQVLDLPKRVARWRPFFPPDVKPLCVAVGTCGLIIPKGRSIGVCVMMISLGIIAVLVFVAVSAVHTSRAP